MQLGDECATALATAPRAFVELQIGTMTIPPSGNPRPAIGATPYALQAVEATRAAGLLEARIASIESSLANLETTAARSQPKTILLAALIFPGVDPPRVVPVVEGAPDGTWISSTAKDPITNTITLTYAPTVVGLGCTVSTADASATFGRISTIPTQNKVEMRMFGTTGTAANVLMSVVCVGQLP